MTSLSVRLDREGVDRRGTPQAGQWWYINRFPYLSRSGWLIYGQTGPVGAMVGGASLSPSLGGFKTDFFVNVLLKCIVSPHSVRNSAAHASGLPAML